MGRYAPYGFRFDPANNARLLKVDREQRAIKAVVQMHGEGQTDREIRKVMKTEYAAAARGKAWRVKTIKKILSRI